MDCHDWEYCESFELMGIGDREKISRLVGVLESPDDTEYEKTEYEKIRKSDIWNMDDGWIHGYD